MNLIKSLIFGFALLLITVIVVSPQAAFKANVVQVAASKTVQGTVQVTFTPTSVAGSTFVVEQLSGITWNQVANGATSPISFTINTPPGTYSFRVCAKNISTNTIGAPSNVVTCVVPITPVAKDATFKKSN